MARNAEAVAKMQSLLTRTKDVGDRRVSGEFVAQQEEEGSWRRGIVIIMANVDEIDDLPKSNKGDYVYTSHDSYVAEQWLSAMINLVGWLTTQHEVLYVQNIWLQVKKHR